jgi:DNA-binding NtrC family response regulator
VILAGEGWIEMRHLPAFLRDRAASAAASPEAPAAAGEEPGVVSFPVGTTVEEAERTLILRTLEHTRNNKTRAAVVLGISLKTLHNKLKEYGVGQAAGTMGTPL